MQRAGFLARQSMSAIIQIVGVITRCNMQRYKEQPRWVMWKYQMVNKKLTKVPFTTKNKHADSTDPNTWSTYDEVRKTFDAKSKVFSGIGIIFTPDQQLLGIDLDHVLDKSSGTLLKEFTALNQLLVEADTYTEISPSGEGLHLYLEIKEPLPLIAHKSAPYEIYTDKRFFTFSNKSYYETQLPVRKVSLEEAHEILKLIGYPWGKKEEVKPSLLDSSSVFTDEQLLDKMFNSKNGERIEALYKGDTSGHNKDDSSADMALLNHLAFWSRKDTAQMERIWLASPLGKREKTQSRKDYRERSITGAIANCKEVYTSPTTEIAGLDLLFTFGPKGEKVYTQNTENMCRILRNHPEFAHKLRFDEFKDQIEIYKNNEWRRAEDVTSIVFQTRISILFSSFRKVSKQMMDDALLHVAKENSIDSAIDFIRSIKWDSIPRLDTWLTETYGCEDNVYHRAVGSNWLKGLVKRITEPGCKFDYVLTLEGPQGSKKSTSLFILGTISTKENWHVETTMSTDSKDFFEQFQGKAIIEFSEGETLSRTEVKKMKAIITTQVDRFRSSYGRFSTDHPRRCVFAMTTNQEQYLKDETGNRRWLPITVKLPEANVEWLQANRDQLFAEAYHRLTTLKETVYEFPREETLREQSSRRITDPNEERVIDWYLNELTDAKRAEGITITQVNQQALHSGFYGTMKKGEEMSIATILKDALHLDKKRQMISGVQMMRWFPTESVMSDKLDNILVPDVKGEFDDDIPFGN